MHGKCVLDAKLGYGGVFPGMAMRCGAPRPVCTETIRITDEALAPHLEAEYYRQVGDPGMVGVGSLGVPRPRKARPRGTARPGRKAAPRDPDTDPEIEEAITAILTFQHSAAGHGGPPDPDLMYSSDVLKRAMAALKARQSKPSSCAAVVAKTIAGPVRVTQCIDITGKRAWGFATNKGDSEVRISPAGYAGSHEP